MSPADPPPADERAEAAPPPSTWRRSAKVLVVAADGRWLLLRMHDPTDAALGEWWELPGGGVEPGEDDRAAAARELREETGLSVHPEQVGPATWTRSATFRWLGVRRWQRESVAVVRLPPTADVVLPTAGPPDAEPGLLGVRWWDPAELAGATAAGTRTYPGRLVELAPALLAGAVVDEGHERWG